MSNPKDDLRHGHRLTMTLSDEGYVQATMICPHGDQRPENAPCFDVYSGSCWVSDAFNEFGMDCFKGTVKLPDLLVEWEGWSGEDLLVMPDESAPSGSSGETP
ncbi:hypothetical protein K6U06_06460 [Acidiferrimicrobium sp. IK]|uniref:hypothetical protein n=1 Tax=Acidiferrimicrobium sp. IK TaxID=2871700 RepID=UPI0021CB80CC|nr:hypothetical protein [Acidiferrimicrobium sp. IK]MCU4183995.1 hypothetical protein [Acidiferrimicrobium sp. IK]